MHKHLRTEQSSWVSITIIALAVTIVGLHFVLSQRQSKAPISITRDSISATLFPDAVKWLKQHAISFKSSQPGSGFDDLLPLKQFIGNARIVALGEATHGTHEFFEMKHRLVEFLVKEMGFNTFAIEANWPESNIINDYVQTGKGDPAKALAGLHFWTWNTQEVLNLIQWMRAHNEHPGAAPRVSFVGFDMQYPWLAMDNVEAYIKIVDPLSVKKFSDFFACFRSYRGNKSQYSSASPDVKSQCHQRIQHAFNELDRQRPIYETASSPKEFAIALQNMRIILQAEALSSTENNYIERDRSMAENVIWLLSQAGTGTKIILWAHNGHASKDNPNYKSMGAYLSEKYGNEMITFGFIFYQGSFNAVTWKSQTKSAHELIAHQALPPLIDSYESFFHQASVSRMFVDLRRAGGTALLPEWMNGPHLSRSIGALYDDCRPNSYFYPTSLPAEFDIIIYFEDTTPSLLLSQQSNSRVSIADTSACPKRPENLDFEAELSNWALAGLHRKNYMLGADSAVKHSGQVSGYLRSTVNASLGMGVAMQQFPADAYRGKRLRMSAFVKTEEVQIGAGLWMRVEGFRGVLLHSDDMRERLIRGTSDWTQYEIVLDVPQISIDIAFGFLLFGRGEIWVDDLQFEVVGSEVLPTSTR